jgi:hypothetical protein
MDTVVYGENDCFMFVPDTHQEIFAFHEHVGKLLKKFFNGITLFSDKLSTRGYTFDTMLQKHTLIDSMLSSSLSQKNYGETREKWISKEEKEEAKDYLTYALPEIDKSKIMPFFEEKEVTKDEWFGRTRNNINTEILLCYDTKVGIVQHVKEGLSVIRVFAVNAHLTGILDRPLTTDDLETYEVKRVYVPNGYPTIYGNHYGDWVQMPRNAHVYSLDDFLLIPWEEEDSIGTPLEHIRETASEYLKENYEKDIKYCRYSYRYEWKTKCSHSLLTALYNPFFESIYTIPLENIRRHVHRCLGVYGDANVTYRFFGDFMITAIEGNGNFPFDDQNGDAKYGDNAMDYLPCSIACLKSFDRLLAKCDEPDRVKEWEIERGNDGDKIREEDAIYVYESTLSSFMKYFKSCPEYLKSMNDKQLDELMELHVQSHFDGYDVNNSLDVQEDLTQIQCVERLVSLFGPKNIANYIRYVYVQFYEMRANEEHAQSYDYYDENWYAYTDYLRICVQMKDEIDRPRWKFSSTRELKNSHDEMVYLYNMKEDEMLEKKTREGFEKAKKRWTGLDYTEDEFSVIMPETAVDIAKEGLVLNHCVKSYIEDVIAGKTNIFFIRKTDDLQTPFYTLEVKDNKLRQCHGFNNCNVCTVAGLEDFIRRYCAEKNIEYSNTDHVLAVER